MEYRHKKGSDSRSLWKSPLESHTAFLYQQFFLTYLLVVKGFHCKFLFPAKYLDAPKDSATNLCYAEHHDQLI